MLYEYSSFWFCCCWVNVFLLPLRFVSCHQFARFLCMNILLYFIFTIDRVCTSAARLSCGLCAVQLSFLSSDITEINCLNLVAGSFLRGLLVELNYLFSLLKCILIWNGRNVRHEDIGKLGAVGLPEYKGLVPKWPFCVENEICVKALSFKSNLASWFI